MDAAAVPAGIDGPSERELQSAIARAASAMLGGSAASATFDDRALLASDVLEALRN